MFHDKVMFGDGKKFYLITIVPFSVFISGEFSQKIDLKDAISTNTKDFSCKKIVQIRQISKIKNFKLPDFYNKFQ